jgi:serine/threonine protein phosphatase 1
MRYAISDIHGCLRTFDKLLETVGFSFEDELYLLGDYVDKGPDSKGVLNRIIELISKGYKVTALMGNHELSSIIPEDTDENYTEEHILFMKSLPFYVELEDCFLVHAGFHSRNPFQYDMHMVYTRQFKYNPLLFKSKKVIHGHTVVSLDTIVASLDKQVIDIDNGCSMGMKNDYDYGSLVCLNLDTMEITSIRNCEYEARIE